MEQRSNLYYLLGYCYLTEANRTFSLDRTHACVVIKCQNAADE
jgi:predicted DNA-binding transcriptional regulator YafY